jgi:hypothetical protein
MKTSRIIAALLVALGFTACEPEEEKVMYGPPEAKYMYGVSRAVFELKPAVPDIDETLEPLAVQGEGEESAGQKNENE